MNSVLLFVSEIIVGEITVKSQSKGLELAEEPVQPGAIEGEWRGPEREQDREQEREERERERARDVTSHDMT